MKTFNKTIIFLSIIITILFACDEIEEPFIENTGQCGDASLPVPIKQILLEEFTGHTCGYCPEGAEIIENLKDLYCDYIIPVAIHAGSFADVYTSGEKFTYGYKTEDGNTINSYFGPGVLPSALINRKEINGTLILDRANWASGIAELLLENPVLDINIKTSFVSATRELEAKIDVIFIESMNDDLMLSVYFVEDSIVSWQKDYNAVTVDVEFYAHNHVLRDAVNGAWGEQILNGQANVSDVKNKSYNYIINQNWVIENSSIVAFVYKNSTKEVLQASQAYLVF